MTNTRKWNLTHYEENRQPVEDCLENALLCEQIAAEVIVSEPIEAIFWQKKALEIRETLYGKNSIENVLQYGRLVEYYLENGASKSALTVAKKILKLREKALGNKHIELANSYLTLSNIYSSDQLADYGNALLYANFAAEIETLNRGAENPLSYRTHLQLAHIYGFRRFQDYQTNMAEPQKSDADTAEEKEHYLLAMKSAAQEYGDTSVEAATCYRQYAHTIESCAEKRLVLCAKALNIFYQAEGAKGANTQWTLADIQHSWTDVRWFPWEYGNDKGMSHLNRKTIGYALKWIWENLSEEMALDLANTYHSRDREMIFDILHSSEPTPPTLR